jgi:hypothetical protein
MGKCGFRVGCLGNGLIREDGFSERGLGESG